MISYERSDPTCEILRIVAEQTSAPADWHHIAQRLDACEVFFAEHLIIVLQSVIERGLLTYEYIASHDTGCYRLTSAGTAYLEHIATDKAGLHAQQPHQQRHQQRRRGAVQPHRQP